MLPICLQKLLLKVILFVAQGMDTIMEILRQHKGKGLLCLDFYFHIFFSFTIKGKTFAKISNLNQVHSQRVPSAAASPLWTALYAKEREG